jgi:5-methylcytosine-specific restriction endonuclease McrA
MSTDYKRFIWSREWKTLRAHHLQQHPLCVLCAAKGIHTLATDVDHIEKCRDNPTLQRNPGNLRSLCRQCHAPLSADVERGYAKTIGADGWPIDPKHPSNR